MLFNYVFIHFRWKQHDSNVLIGVACHRVWKLWRKDNDEIAFQVLTKFSQAQTTDDTEVLKKYFQVS